MARDFDGTTDYLELTSAVETAAPCTLVAWANVDNLTDGHCLVGLCAKASSNGFFLYAEGRTSDRVFAYSDQSSTFDSASSASSYTTGTWFHAGAVFASSTSRTAYLNGVAGTTNTTSNTPSGISHTMIGAAWYTNSLLDDTDGRIAEVGIWNAALTTAEMAMLAKGLSPLFVRPASLVLYAPMLGRADPEPDLVGANVLTVNGTPSQSAHPRIIYPSKARRTTKTAAVAPPSGGLVTRMSLLGVGL